MSDDNTTNSFVAALASLLIAGLGQFIQGRTFMGIVQFILWAGLWVFMAGWIITIWSVIDAFVYNRD